MNLTQDTQIGSLTDEQTLWQARNRRAISEIAKQFGVSRTTVYKVFRGNQRSAGLRIEGELARRGCPGFHASELAGPPSND